MKYGKELAKYIDVDIYGGCGKFHCSRSNLTECYRAIDKNYKFYLSFENSNCRGYITQQFFITGLKNNILPVVMGAPKEDYEDAASTKSFIHVELAAYLHKLDKNDNLYNEYFQWKGSGEITDTSESKNRGWCRLCAMLHAPFKPKYYKDVNRWWSYPGVCTKEMWRRKSFVFT